MSDSKQISIGVGIAPLVVSQRKAKVNEKVPLELISGLTPEGIIWRSGEDVEVNVDEDISVTFTVPGFYRPVILGHLQHESYGIYVEE